MNTVLLAGMLVAAGGSTAHGAVTIADPFLRVQATSSLGSGEYIIPFADAVQVNPSPPNQTWLAFNNGVFDIVDPNNNNVIAQVQVTGGASLLAQAAFPANGGWAYSIAMDLTVTSGAADTTFSIQGPTLMFDQINANFFAAAELGANMTNTLDGNGTGSMNGLNNGFIGQFVFNPGDTDEYTFAELHDGFQNIADGASIATDTIGGTDQHIVGSPVPFFNEFVANDNLDTSLAVSATPPIRSMTTQADFTLTAGDQGAFVSSFSAALPTPGTVMLIGAAGVFVCSRRRR